MSHGLLEHRATGPGKYDEIDAIQDQESGGAEMCSAEIMGAF